VIALIDYGAGNLTSVRKALTSLGAGYATPASPGELRRLLRADRSWRRQLRRHGSARRSVARRDCAEVGGGKPLFGICLGMQWLFEGSDEAPEVRARRTAGRVARLRGDAEQRLKIPHVGWNASEVSRTDRVTPAARILAGLDDGRARLLSRIRSPLRSPTPASPQRRTRKRLRRWSSATTSSACSSIPRSRATRGCRIMRNFLESSRACQPRRRARRPDADQAHHRLHGRPRRQRRQGRAVSAASPCRRSAELAARYNVEGIDEVVILDITATLESRRALADTIHAVAQRIFLPLTVGGGIRSEDDAAAAVDAGADKVSLNTAALNDPELIADAGPRATAARR
jgi:hypothetical protein